VLILKYQHFLKPSFSKTYHRVMDLDWDGLVRQFEELGMTLVLSQDKRSYALGMQQNG
jgi:hypothetical protein